jgi:hypothetical protein
MNSKLHALFQAEQEGLAASLYARILATGMPHYQIIDDRLLRVRCEKLVHAFVESIRHRSTSFSDYVGEIAEERISEGYDLKELQTALAILEGQAWMQCTRHLYDLCEMVEALSLVTRFIGSARDQVAQIYLEHCGRLTAGEKASIAGSGRQG